MSNIIDTAKAVNGKVYEIDLEPFYSQRFYLLYCKLPKPVGTDVYMPIIACVFDSIDIELSIDKMYLSPLYLIGFGRMNKLFPIIKKTKYDSSDLPKPHARSTYAIAWDKEGHNLKDFYVKNYRCETIAHDQPYENVAHLEHKPFLPEELVFRISYEVMKRTGEQPKIPFSKDDIALGEQFYLDVLTIDKQPKEHPFQLAPEFINVIL
jgi:hypothetical protein